jgi:hypothetical protein
VSLRLNVAAEAATPNARGDGQCAARSTKLSGTQRLQEVTSRRQFNVESCGSRLRTWGAACCARTKAVWLGGAGFVDEFAEVAFGVAAVGVATVFVFFGDDVEKFFDGAALRGQFVQFKLRSQAAQEFCRFEHVGSLENADEAANRTRGLRNFLRNSHEIFVWWVCALELRIVRRACSNGNVLAFRALTGL